MFFQVPSIKKSLKQAFSSVKIKLDARQVYLYPITDDLVYVLTENTYSKKEKLLKKAKALKNLLREYENFILIASENDEIVVAEVKDRQPNILTFQKEERALLAYFLSLDRIPVVFVINDDKDVIGLLNSIEEPIKYHLIEVKLKDEDYQQILREISYEEYLKNALDFLKDKSKVFFKKYKRPALTVLIGAALLIGGAYGYKYYKQKKWEEARKKQIQAVYNSSKTPKINIYEAIIPFVDKTLNKVEYIEINRLNFKAFAKALIEGTQNTTKINDRYILSGNIKALASINNYKGLEKSKVNFTLYSKNQTETMLTLNEAKKNEILSVLYRQIVKENKIPLSIVIQKKEEGKYYFRALFTEGGKEIANKVK